MEPLLCEVMSVLHELMERAVEVTVCKGSFGRKDAIETLTVAKAQEDEDCILLPFLNG